MEKKDIFEYVKELRSFFNLDDREFILLSEIIKKIKREEKINKEEYNYILLELNNEFINLRKSLNNCYGVVKKEESLEFYNLIKRCRMSIKE